MYLSLLEMEMLFTMRFIFNNCFDFILSDKVVTEDSKTGNEFFSIVNKNKLKSMNSKMEVL